MNRRRRYDQLEELQLAIFHSLLTGPGTPAWLSERLRVDGGHLSRTLRLMEESEVPWDQIAFPTVRKTLTHYYADRRNGEFKFHMGTVERLPENEKEKRAVEDGK